MAARVIRTGGEIIVAIIFPIKFPYKYSKEPDLVCRPPFRLNLNNRNVSLVFMLFSANAYFASSIAISCIFLSLSTTLFM